MSKLFDVYKRLKNEDSETFYLFKSGIFYIFLDEDAKTINKFYNLKLTYLNAEIVKCGFPLNSLQKYLNLFNNFPYKIKIIDNFNNDYNTVFNINDFSMYNESVDLIKKISSVNVENLSIKEAFDFIYEIKSSALKILK